MSQKRTIHFFLLACVLLLNSCTGFFNKPPKSNCDRPQKIRGIAEEDVYDLSGYMASGGSSAFRLFDENDQFDPKNGETGTPVTSAQPTRQADIFFPLGKGNRIVVDLRVPYKLSEVYVYDQSHTADSIWIYTGSMSNWKLQTAFISSGDPMGWGWRRFSVQDSTQFVMISFSTPTADLKEMILYGCATAPMPPRKPQRYSGARLPRKNMRDFLGVNMYNSLPLEWLQPFHAVRMYTIANNFDMDTINEYPNVKFSISRYGYLYQQHSFRHFADDLLADGKEIWYSVRGVPVWMNKKGMWDNDRPVTRIGMDPENPHSYARHANMMWTLAAVFGKTKVDTNELQINDMIKVSGKGTMTRFENGNEEDASWVGKKYCSPMEYYAQSSADYDGDMGRIGNRTGIHTADSNAELIMSGMVEFDTNRVRVLNFLCNQLRPDKKFLWQGGVQYHHYSNAPVGKGFLHRRKSTIGITPEEDSLRSKLARVREHAYNLQPNVECILGEYGYDKSQLSRQATPIVPGHSPAESQAIMLIRGINATAFSGFDRMIIYWMKDDVDENNPNTYLTSGLIRDEQNGKFTPYPAWYYVNTFVHYLGNFISDSIVSETGNVWTYRYRQQTNADSLAYFVYCPTRSGTTVKGFLMTIPSGFTSATEVQFLSNSTSGVPRNLSISNAKISIDVGEVPKLILLHK